MSGVSFTTLQDSENRLTRWTRTNGEDQSWAFGTRVKSLPGFARPANRLSGVGLHRRPAAGPPASTSLSASPLDRARADGILSTRVPSLVGDWNSTAGQKLQGGTVYPFGELRAHDAVHQPLSLHVKAGVNAGSTYWYHLDRQYNVIGLTNSSGAVVERYAYTAYGARRVLDPNGVTERSYSALGNARGHQGLWHDDESGLIYNRARYRSSVLGRWMGRDPLGYVASVCLYQYLNGRLGKMLDPSGNVPVADAQGNTVGSSLSNQGTQCCRRTNPRWKIWHSSLIDCINNQRSEAMAWTAVAIVGSTANAYELWQRRPTSPHMSTLLIGVASGASLQAYNASNYCKVKECDSWGGWVCKNKSPTFFSNLTGSCTNKCNRWECGP